MSLRNQTKADPKNKSDDLNSASLHTARESWVKRDLHFPTLRRIKSPSKRP
jgi:hypothetical protein